MNSENKDTRIILDDLENQFIYEKKTSNLQISFNRISFIFFVFFIFF